MKYILCLLLLAGCSEIETVVLPESSETEQSAYVYLWATSIYTPGYYTVVLDRELDMNVSDSVYVYWAGGRITGVQRILYKTHNRQYEIDVPIGINPVFPTRITRLTR